MMQPVEYATATPQGSRERLYNFSAGPGVLPAEVLEEARNELPVYPGIGSSVLEISHRSPTYTDIAASAKSRIRSLLGVGDEWHVLFLMGGASLQFHQVPLNFIPKGGSADYLNTGAWSTKAIKEANIIASAREAASSAGTNFDHIPDAATWDLSDEAAYLHFTSNNTIFGTQFREEPKAQVPLVCDASSDFLSRPLDMSRYGLIYAGAQKNVGPAGVTIVLVHDDFLQTQNDGLPTLLAYKTHAAKLFHTPPVFAVYFVEKVMRWIEHVGGLEAMAERNERKASVLYDAIDASDFYRGTAQPDSRSLMNVCFRLPSEDLEARFIAEAKDAGLLALKGHRSVGGIRASIYNACPPQAVDALVDFMQTFERKA